MLSIVIIVIIIIIIIIIIFIIIEQVRVAERDRKARGHVTQEGTGALKTRNLAHS